MWWTIGHTTAERRGAGLMQGSCLTWHLMVVHGFNITLLSWKRIKDVYHYCLLQLMRSDRTV